MKKLGSILAVVFLFACFFGATTSYVEAQNAPVVANISMLSETSSKIFTQVLNQLNPGSSQIDKNLYDLIKGAQNQYDKSIQNDKNTGGGMAMKSAKDVYIKALNSSVDYINSNKNDSKFQDQKSISVITNLLNLLNGEINNQGLVQNFSKPTDEASKATESAKQAAAKKAEDTKEQCSINFLSSDGVNIGACVTAVFNWFIKSILLNIAGVLLWLSATIFNKAVILGILDFSRWAPESLYPIWIVIRQIVSLLLVFVGLYLGFLYILGREDKFEKYIPWVVIFGLFVNFSYPLARTAIDVSNIVTLKVYTSAFGSNVLDENSVQSETSPGSSIMRSLGLSGLVTAAVNKKDGAKGETGFSENLDIPGSLLTVVYVLYSAYVLFRFALLVIVRTVVFVFMIIASPLLLVDSVLPVLGDKAKDLRKVFLEQLAVGPVFMILFVITLRFLEVFKVTNIPKTNADFIASSFTIILMLAMLQITLKVTTKIAGEAGAWGTEKLGKIGGFGLGVATGGTGLLARQTIGRGATMLRDSKWVERNQDSFLGRRAYDLSNSVAKSSFDLRNSKIVARGAGMAGLDKGLFGTGMGTGKSTNYEQGLKERLDKKKVIAGRIKTKYERDVYKTNEKGEVQYDPNTGLPIVEHKAGETVEDAVNTRMRYLQGDASRFMTKEEKEKLADQELDASVKANEALYKEKKKKGGGADKKFVSELETRLQELKKSDKDLKSIEARTVVKTLESIKKDSDNFDKRVTASFEQYGTYADAKDRKKFIDSKVLGSEDEDFKKDVLAKIYESTKANKQEQEAFLNSLPQEVRTSLSGSSASVPEAPEVTTTISSNPYGSKTVIPSSSINTSELDKAGFEGQVKEVVVQPVEEKPLTFAEKRKLAMDKARASMGENVGSGSSTSSNQAPAPVNASA